MLQLLQGRFLGLVQLDGLISQQRVHIHLLLGGLRRFLAGLVLLDLLLAGLILLPLGVRLVLAGVLGQHGPVGGTAVHVLPRAHLPGICLLCTSGLGAGIGRLVRMGALPVRLIIARGL